MKGASMEVVSRSLRAAVVLVVVLSSVLMGFAQQTVEESARIDRLVALARLWAAVKYFHPYLGYRGDIDWDAALTRAVPKVNAATNRAEYAGAIGGMLSELNDPLTHLLGATGTMPANHASSADRQPTFKKNADGVLIVTMTNYADLEDRATTQKNFDALKKEFPTAKAVAFDLRPTVKPTEREEGLVYDSIGGIAGALTTVPLETPGDRRLMHSGYAPQDGTVTSGGYTSSYYDETASVLQPESGAVDIPVVFLIGPGAELPDMALTFQSAGRGAIIQEGSFRYSELDEASTQTIDLPYSLKAQIRMGEMVYPDGTSGFAPTVSVPASSVKGDQNPAYRAALQLAHAGKFSPPARVTLPTVDARLRDKAYAEMEYPPAEYRVLAAFRLWAVIDYFYPYRDLMGEDWDGILLHFIVKMEGAKDAVDYHLAVAEMATHIHDTHAYITDKFLDQYFGEASAPVRVRVIDGLPVITGFTNAEVASRVGLEIGDVIIKVDGVDAGERMAERLRYIAHSTPQSGMFWSAESSLTQGPKDSTAIYTIRDIHDHEREVKVARKPEYKSTSTGDRTGDALKVLPGNIGYADLDRLSVAQVDEMFDKFRDCPAIIFDGRGYPRGTAWSIAPRLTNRNDVVAARFRLPVPMSIKLPDGETAEFQMVKTFAQRLPRTEEWRYHGTTVMLIDERTWSQGEHTGLFLEAANNTKFIGSATQGADGDVTNLSVPGGIFVHFSGQGISHADGRQLQRVGLRPDIEAFPTLAGIRTGRDEVLDAAIYYLEHLRE
jgi:C-terminal processing protease CtpA/Prc